jgi:hypothetical protein
MPFHWRCLPPSAEAAQSAPEGATEIGIRMAFGLPAQRASRIDPNVTLRYE